MLFALIICYSLVNLPCHNFFNQFLQSLQRIIFQELQFWKFLGYFQGKLISLQRELELKDLIPIQFFSKDLWWFLKWIRFDDYFKHFYKFQEQVCKSAFFSLK